MDVAVTPSSRRDRATSASGVRCSVLKDQPKDLLVNLSRCAKARITLRAKCGVWPTRKRNCFSEMGTSSTSVTATAVALRGSLSISAISPKMLSAPKVGHHSIADLVAHVTALDNEKLVSLLAFARIDTAGSDRVWILLPVRTLKLVSAVVASSQTTKGQC